jgi:hypothetical protein
MVALKYSNTITTSVDGDGIKKCFAIPPIAVYPMFISCDLV